MKRSDKLRAMEATWTLDEDDVLRHAVFEHGGKKWKVIAMEFRPPRTPSDCQHRWNYLQNHGSNEKQPWNAAEDERMVNLIHKYGAGKWAVIASYLPGRNGKQCRERWHNQLNPAINKNPWSAEENEIILHMQATSLLPGWGSLSLVPPQLKKTHKSVASPHQARKTPQPAKVVVAPAPHPPLVDCSQVLAVQFDVPAAGEPKRAAPHTPPKLPVPSEPLGSLSPVVVSKFDWSTTLPKPLDKWLDDLPDDSILESLTLADQALFAAPDYIFTPTIDLDNPDLTDVMDLILGA
ncbi:hypothetical protein H310_03995 [Aphanomyces invadans]|uniref:Uncharacterized protein n=1 Tax=Aphanomyces invadans TaxID=157072 RepID=A0A024UGA7_9STRA|nr:hypothetical protein H310_03995 [Aphanomyces invadans]ETW04887.1 hypothetical protein H310_03995 [Aphanomyces invadans]|eukprot:XP_008866325.1 hypothetical protein H310_03995 [Aphanomyces invadans]